MEYIKAVIKCEIKVMDPPLKSVRGREEQSGLRSSFASEGEEFERRTDGDEKESEVGQKRLSFVEGARGNDRSSLVSPETDLTC